MNLWHKMDVEVLKSLNSPKASLKMDSKKVRIFNFTVKCSVVLFLFLKKLKTIPSLQAFKAQDS